jgi:hypothetical protein
MKILFVLFLLVSCGVGTDPGLGEAPSDPYPDYPGVITYNVPSKFYYKYKNALDWVSSDLVSQSGKHLVRFKPNDNMPEFESMRDALNDFRKTGEGWLLIKEDDARFTNLGERDAGVAYVGSPERPIGVFILNLSTGNSWSEQKFRQVANHEILHNLGYRHNGDHSILNYSYLYNENGITDLDNQRLAGDFPFSLAVVTVKDLEKVGASVEGLESENYKNYIVENYGLSEERAQTVSRLMLNSKRVGNKRSLTDRERNLLSHEILGFGYNVGKKALEDYIAGESDSLDSLVDAAAEKNETTPEHVRELVGEIFL